VSAGVPATPASVAVPFAAIVLAMLPAVLDQTILATALPVVATELGAITDVSWVVTAHLISAAATTLALLAAVAARTTGFFRALGGAVGAAVLGAVFAARAGAPTSEGAGAGVVDGGPGRVPRRHAAGLACPDRCPAPARGAAAHRRRA
jgi:hypothetical protein